MKLVHSGLIAALGLVLIGVSVADAQQVRLRASGAFPAGHTSSKAMEAFKAEVEERSGGAIRIDLFPGNQLGGAYQQVDQIRAGQVAFVWSGPNWFSRLVPEVDVANMPFSSATPEQAFCLIDSGLDKLIGEKFAERDILFLAWGANGHRHLTNDRRPINSVEDLKGLKIRVTPSDLNLATFRAVGAVPTPMDIGELYQALQQGVVDGQENPYDNIRVRRFDEVQQYLSNSGHFYGYVGFYMHKATFESLSSEHQTIIRETMEKVVAEQRVTAERENTAALQTLIDRGMQYDEIPPAELAKFREAMKEVYEMTRGIVGDEAMDLALKAMDNCAN